MRHNAGKTYPALVIDPNAKQAIARLLKKIGYEKSESIKDLAYCLYDIAANRLKSAEEATYYNGLISIWGDIIQMSIDIEETVADRQMNLQI